MANIYTKLPPAHNHDAVYVKKDEIGAWKDWTPTDTWTGGTTDFTSAGVMAASYCKVGKLLFVNVSYQLGTLGTGNRTQLTLTLPTGIDVEKSGALQGLETVTQTTWSPVGARAYSSDNKIYVHFSTAPTRTGYMLITGVCKIA